MGGGFILAGGFTPPSTPPKSPKLKPESPQLRPSTPPRSPSLKPESPRTITNDILDFVPIEINNRVVYVPEHLGDDFSKAVKDIKIDCGRAMRIKKDLILDPDMLIELLNHAKYHWHSTISGLSSAKVSASEWIENLFINNRYLCEKESRLVRRIISEYKSLVEDTVAQNNLTPIAPMPIIDRASSRSSRLCDIL